MKVSKDCGFPLSVPECEILRVEYAGPNKIHYNRISVSDSVEFLEFSNGVSFARERTCEVNPTTCKNEIFIERIHEYECMSCSELVPMYINDGRPNYCPHCGAKVVE